MILRRFTKAGIAEFRQFLEQCRQQPDTAVSLQLLTNDALTAAVEPAIEVEDRAFANRREAAEYLRRLLRPLSEQDERGLLRDDGLWSWLALCYFDQLRPVKNGQRKVKNDYYYVFEADLPLYYYRHLLFVAWRIAYLAPAHNRLFLDRPLAVYDQVTDEVMKRLHLTRIPCLFEVLDKLYWDGERQAPRKGIVDQSRSRPGGLRQRFNIRIRQLEMTYDLQSLNADQLIELLGEEFDFDRRALAS